MRLTLSWSETGKLVLNVVSFYRFIDLADPELLRVQLQSLCDERKLLGTILVAKEGVNGTLAGNGDDIRLVFDWLSTKLDFTEPMDARWTDAETAPFRRMRVRVKKEIVTLGRPDILPQHRTGRHVLAGCIAASTRCVAAGVERDH